MVNDLDQPWADDAVVPMFLVRCCACEQGSAGTDATRYCTTGMGKRVGAGGQARRGGFETRPDEFRVMRCDEQEWAVQRFPPVAAPNELRHYLRTSGKKSVRPVSSTRPTNANCPS